MLLRAALRMVLASAALAAARRYTEEEYVRLGDVLGGAGSRVGAAAAVEVRVDGGAGAPQPLAGRGGTDVSLRFIEPAAEKLQHAASARLDALLEDTFSDECRSLVTQKFTDMYLRALSEDWLPYENLPWQSQCTPQSPKARLPRLDAAKVRIAYLLIVHEEPKAIERLVDALDEPLHNFVLHVDGKAASAATFDAMQLFAAKRPNVHIMEHGRQNISWGGFNIVRATLNGLDYILDHLANDFDYVATVSGYTYPLVANHVIRETLASFPADTEFLEVRPQPNVPQPRAWHQFVECDNKMRRIWRLQPPAGVSMFMGSQWMVVTKQFAEYVTHRRTPATAHHFDRAAGGSFAARYEEYATGVMVADENYFVTVLKNSPFCNRHENTNFLHVQFDRWEHDKAVANNNKCLQPNPQHCGRSPTTLTLDYLPVLDLGGAMFARKFDARHDAAILDAIDERRSEAARAHARDLALPAKSRAPPVKVEPLQILHVRFVRRDAAGRHFCATIGDEVQRWTRSVALQPCDDDDVMQRFSVGPCSRDGTVALGADGPLAVTPGRYAPAPFCPIRSDAHFPGLEGYGSCLDLERESISAGTSIIAFACSGRWNQLFGFGTGVGAAPGVGAVYINVPYAAHVPKELCLEAGASGASNLRVAACDESAQQTFFVEPLPA
ncbi:core-2/I-branching enzyme-domain-containing protein [Pelagophyceae sp. CCMP2097]|nr:core-2/I-branching enzyme-domain-containing protein [Pelagophyceae sp. CCMP2097]